MVLNYRVVLEDGRFIAGSHQLVPGENRVRVFLPDGKIRRVTAETSVPIYSTDKIFMNGYQTWTHCPEYGSRDKIRGLSHLPRMLVNHYGLDRYGDYYFTEYPEKEGVTHGESFCYFRRGDDFRLFASLDERPGYTLFRYDSSSSVLSLERDCAGINCGGEFPVFELFYGKGTEDEVYDGWFAAMGIRPRTLQKTAGYSSWYNRYQDISEDCILQDLNGCASVLYPGDMFQIDDGWEPAVGDWLETDPAKFPNGLAPLAREIHSRGFKAGLWLAPFVAQESSKLMAEHPDWLLKHDGKPWYCGCNWGGFYALDIDNPEFIAYLEKVFDRVFNEWGFDLVKLDFLYGGAVFGTENESRAGRMYRALELLRRLCGDKLILGCGVPVMPAFGIVDYCRISCDVGLDWNDTRLMQHAHRERVSTKQAIENTLFRRQLNGRAYLSDPDVFFLRDNNIKLSPEQKTLLAKINALFGGVWFSSDDMSGYNIEKKLAYRRLRDYCFADSAKVNADGGLSVSCTVNGKSETLIIG